MEDLEMVTIHLQTTLRMLLIRRCVSRGRIWQRSGVDSKPGCVASSSQSQIPLKSHFVEMGFSRPLVDRVFREIGGNDEELLLETLCTYSVVEESPADMIISENDNLTPMRNEEDNFGSEYKDSDGNQGSEVNFLPDEGFASVTPAGKRASLQMMKFFRAEIDIAFERMGVEASVEALVDFIISKQAVNDSGTMDAPLAVGGESVQKKISTNGTFDLLEMGFAREEVSKAFANHEGEPLISIRWRPFDLFKQIPLC